MPLATLDARTLLQLLLMVSAIGSIMAMGVWILRVLCRDRLSSAAACAMWGLVGLRLIIPIVPESRFSIIQFLPQPASTPQHESAAVAVLILNAEPTPLADAPVPSAPVPALIPAPQTTKWSWPSIILILWAAGALIVIARFIAGHVALRRILRRDWREADADVMNLLAQCQTLIGVRRRVRVIQSSAIAAPAVMGLWRPSILLPESLSHSLSTDQLRGVLMHELVHIRRWDIAANWLWAIARAIHWFNPFVWLAWLTYLADRELACDAAVLQHLHGDERETYGNTLLAVVSHVRGADLHGSTAGMGQSGARLRRRIERIASDSRSSLFVAILAIGLLLIACLGLTRTQAQAAMTTAPSTTSSLITRIYDLSGLMKNLEGGFVLIRSHAGIPNPRSISDELALSQRQENIWMRLNDELYGQQHHYSFGSALDLEARFNGHQFIVSTTEANHEKLDALFRKMHESGKWAVELQSRFIGFKHPPRDLPPSVARLLEGMFPSSPDKVLNGKFLNDEEADGILEWFKSEPDVSLVTAPKITLFNGQQSYVMVATQQWYLSAIKSMLLPDGTINHDGRIDLVGSGIILVAQPEIANDRKSVSLTLQQNLTTLLRLDTADLPNALDSRRLTIQKPVTSNVELSTTVSIPDKRTLMYVTKSVIEPEGAEGERTWTILLLRPTILDPDKVKPQD